MRRKLSKKEIEKHYSWQEGDTTYEWYGNGMLKSVRLPNGKVVSFEYDALGRRTLKEFRGIRYRYAWDGNVLLHEWNYHSWTKPIRKKDKYGRYSYSSPEPLTNVTTWVYDGQSHTPVAKFTEEDCYSIVQDHLGTPTQAFDSRGNKVWDCVLDIYGDIQMIEGDRDFIPFRFQGQYADVETGLYYNRFRYYSPELGNYISQDPIRMAGNNPTLYGYVKDSNSWIDVWGLDIIRLRHYTSNKGLQGIKESMVIKAGDQNAVFATRAKGKPLSKTDAAAKFKIKETHARNYIDFDIDDSRVEYRKNNLGVEEYKIKGDIELDLETTDFVKRCK